MQRRPRTRRIARHATDRAAGEPASRGQPARTSSHHISGKKYARLWQGVSGQAEPRAPDFCTRLALPH
eukprot:3142709-Prymnesium_polylepis.1